jgi:DNA gyrase subunit B
VAKESSYSEKDIQVLEGLEAVKKRPGMYIGSTSLRGLHHLVYEVVDNAVDEALAGYCTKILVTIHEDNSITVVDNGRGIPVGKHPKMKIPTVEVVMTVLHAGGKFGGSGYKVSGGLHGVGVSVVNALSTRLEVEVKRDNKIYAMDFDHGKTHTKLHQIGTYRGKATGTTITYWPDPEVFETIEHDFDTLATRLREIAYLTKGLKITFTDERAAEPRTEEYCYSGGIVDFVKDINKDKETLFAKPIYFEARNDDGLVEVAMQWNTTYTETVLPFANNIHTGEGGTHLEGFRHALTKTINDYARSRNILKDKDTNLTGDDVREGLVAVISVKLHDPQFEGQTKTKLGNSEIRGLVQSAVNQGLSEYFEEHPGPAKAVINKSSLAKKAREAARMARDRSRKTGLEHSTLPGKLADCSLNDPELTELFIVEGDSAGGSAKQARERSFQAILPLRGKILNIERSGLHRALSSDTINALITAVGTNIADNFDITKARYHKIIIMTDADVDGAHIRCLLLTFFYRYMPEMINAGYIYIAQPPLYQLKVGKKKEYIFNDAELRKAIDALPEEVTERKSGKPGYTVSRYKGLGEMDPEELGETTMNPENRTLLRVDIEDVFTAEQAVSDLMGSQVEPRKEFIQSHAKDVRFLDI